MSQRTTKPTIRHVTSEDSDQPVHLSSLIRVFGDCMCLLQPPGYSKRNEQELLPILGRCTGAFAGHKGLIVGFVSIKYTYLTRAAETLSIIPPENTQKLK